MARQLLQDKSDKVIEMYEVVGPMSFSFDNVAYRLWLQDIMKQFVLTVRPGTNHWYLAIQ